jgi:hypothetical protein
VKFMEGMRLAYFPAGWQRYVQMAWLALMLADIWLQLPAVVVISATAFVCVLVARRVSKERYEQPKP